MFSLSARFLLGLVSVCAPFALADDQSKSAKIEELLQLMQIDKFHSQVIQQVAASQVSPIPTTGTAPEARAAAEELQRKLSALVTERMRWEKMKVEYVRACDARFSAEEVDGILAFYKSSLGQSVREKMPLALAETRAQLFKRLGADREFGQEFQRLVREAAEKSRSQSLQPLRLPQ